MTCRGLICAVLLILSVPAASQIYPSPDASDSRLQTINYKRNQVVAVEAAIGYQVLIELAPDEQIQSIALGDSSAWQATATRQGNRLYLKALKTGANSNMTVVTTARLYAFDLIAAPGPSPATAYKISFRYPDTDRADTEQLSKPDPEAIVAWYKLAGDRSLLPTWVVDDGHKTYIGWPRAVSLPAVFLIDDHDRETVANGSMRDGTYVIDDVAKRVLFRLDGKMARADRGAVKKPRT